MGSLSASVLIVTFTNDYKMQKSLDQRIKDVLINGSPGARKMICEREPVYFAIYYFPEYFNYKIPSFHFDFYEDIKGLASGVLQEAAWIAYRDSAKTSLAKIAFVIWLIAFKKKKYINWDSYDKGNAEQALFDITVALQTNKKLISDFGHLYFKKATKDAMSEAKMKRISSFITENDVKVEAFSTQESTRGRVYKEQRPDCFILDDLENSKTAESYPITHKIIKHYDEMKAGLPANACVLTLGNYITEEGVVAYIMEKVSKNSRGVLRNVPVVSKEGIISWPDKYVLTKEEAAKINAETPNSSKWKISLEAKKEDLGRTVYEAEMMNNPAHGADKVFDRDRIEEMLKISRPPSQTVAGLKIWSTFNPSHRYAIGADTAKGIGKDANASVIIDYSTAPNRVVATYKNNLMAPDIFAYELKRQGELYGLPLIAPEINNTGYATLTQLKKIYPLPKIYIAMQDEKVKEIINPDYGWDTNNATKPEMIFQMKRAIEDGILTIPDEDLLNELKYYDQKALNAYKLVEGMTRHYDLLMACAIAWAMRTHAKVSDQGKKQFKQGTYVPGEYQG